MEGERQILKLG